jgi:demethylmenaquinone methyltransferase/2-methoxy-6-polyprenyl-1,4-benzoquinol methylase
MDEVTEYYHVIRSAFKKLAPFYDLMAVPVLSVRQQVAELLPDDVKLNILDVATGTGTQAFAFARKGHEVTGVDLSEEMLDIAMRHSSNFEVKFQVADAAALPFSDGQFDVCSISFALHDMPLIIRGQVLEQMVRVVKPDGIILIVDYALPQSEIGKFLIHSLISFYESEYYQQFIRSDLESLFSQAGIVMCEEKKVLMGAACIVIGTPMMKISESRLSSFGEPADRQAQGNR